jgi:hypothetical protein
MPFAVENNPYLEFETLLDKTCFRLQSKQAQYSIRKLIELEAILINLERELDIIVNLVAKSPLS